MAQQQPLPTPPSRRVNPQILTSFLPTIHSSTSGPASAISPSSMTSGSQQPSPVMSPRTQLTTNNSSIQASPEGPIFRDAELPPPLELPESVLVSRKSSQTSAMTEAVAISKAPGIIRRLSNKATSKFGGRRRQSSTAANSREQSTGPVIMRRRSDSTNNMPELRPALVTESDDELAEQRRMDYNVHGDDSDGSPSNNLSIGPTIPGPLLQGSPLAKVKKNNKRKVLTFTLDIHRMSVCWDRNRPHKHFLIDDIKEIRSGADVRNYRIECGVLEADEEKFFSIVYAVPNKSQKVMHLVAHDEVSFHQWTSTLDSISKHRHELMASLSSFNDKAVRAYWHREMTKRFGDRLHSPESEVIDLPGVERLCRSLHIHGVQRHLRAMFAQADVSNTGQLSFKEFQRFISLMKRREDIRAIYESIVSPARSGLSLDEFLSFLEEVQSEDVVNNRDHWKNIFLTFVRQANKTRANKEHAQHDFVDEQNLLMSEAAFSSYLTSKDNLPLKPTPKSFTLDRPLNEYFISSSHNTYLMGRQFQGISSIEAYIAALSKGCRCVEIDCWDGPNGPIVTHGRTLTSSISFHDVMVTTSKYAFVKSQFPLIISLEVHCSDAQQAMMADIIRSTCGSHLVTEPLDPESQQLPSPSQLVSRILIKVKMPRDEESATPEPSFGRRRGASVNSPAIRPVVRDNALVQTSTQVYSPPMSPRQRPTVLSSSRKPSRVRLPSNGDFMEPNSNSETEGLPEEGADKRKQSNIIKALGELGVYAAGVKFQGFDARESKTYNHIYSFVENTFKNNSDSPDKKRLLIRHNMRYLMRVYPSQMKVLSQNFNPLIYWRRGVQMAALNWQTYDVNRQMNDAMFAAGTDVSGYVLKPKSLREITMLQNVPEAAGAGHVKRERKQLRFEIDVISAQQLMRPEELPDSRTVDPYVDVEVFHADDKTKGQPGVSTAGSHNDTDTNEPSGVGAPRRKRTHIISENGFNPVFNSRFQFHLTTKYPELVFVRFIVRASRNGHSFGDMNTPIAVYTAKLSSLQQGYRTLPLMDTNGDQFLFSTLFCKIKVAPLTSVYIDDPVESGSRIRNIARGARSVVRGTSQGPYATPKSSTEMLLNSSA